MLSFALISYERVPLHPIFTCSKNMCSSSEDVHSIAKEKKNKNCQLSELASSQMHEAEALSVTQEWVQHTQSVSPAASHLCFRADLWHLCKQQQFL